MDAMIKQTMQGYLAAFDSANVTDEGLKAEIKQHKSDLKSIAESSSDVSQFMEKLTSEGINEKQSELIAKAFSPQSENNSSDEATATAKQLNTSPRTKVKQHIKKYIQKATIRDWINRVLFGVLILIIFVPSSRLYFYKTYLRWTMEAPDIKKEIKHSEIPGSWSLLDKEGNTIQFEQFKNQKVFINFWASWRGPCLVEIPSLIEKSKALKGEVTFIFLTKDKQENASRIIEQYKSETAHFYFYDNCPKPLQHDSDSIPFSVWINEGVKTAYNKGAAKWSSQDIIDGFEKATRRGENNEHFKRVSH